MTDREYERSMDRSYNEWLRLLVSFIKNVSIEKKDAPLAFVKNILYIWKND
ncbi:MAG: hypothetical protein MJY47_01050 [Fibrobacter sp.]|nr:hypothetical protein [Fibrobacter sp.]